MASDSDRISAYRIAARFAKSWQEVAAHAEEILGLVRSTVRLDLKPQIDEAGVAAALVHDLARQDAMRQQRAEAFEDGYEECKRQMLEVLSKLRALKTKDRKGSECFLRELKRGPCDHNLDLIRDYIESFHDSNEPERRAS